MPTTIKILLEFVTTAADTRSFADSVSHDRDSTDEGKENLAREMFAELRKAVSFAEYMHVLPDLGDILLQSTSASPARPSGPMAFLDLLNVPALWLEISNTFTDLRFVLAQAKGYKDLEPLNSSPVSDQLCAYLHFQKMYMLNLAVFQLVKIQDLVVRLLQESFSGRLISVDYDDDGWERDLKLSDAKKGLKNLVKNGDLADHDYRAILDALSQPSKSPHRETVVRYRNRVAHGIRPSVDYPDLYTEVEDRAGKLVKDASGKDSGRVYSLRGGKSKSEFLFGDLYAALSDYMEHVADMLKALKSINRLA